MVAEALAAQAEPFPLYYRDVPAEPWAPSAPEARLITVSVYAAGNPGLPGLAVSEQDDYHRYRGQVQGHSNYVGEQPGTDRILWADPLRSSGMESSLWERGSCVQSYWRGLFPGAG